MTSPTTRSRWLGYTACAAAGCLWGTGFFFGKLALREMSVAHMVLYRFLFACLGTLPMSWIARREFQSHQRVRWTARDRIILLVSAMLGIPLQFLLQFEGLAHTTVSHASLMVGTLPVMLALAATLFTSERMDSISWFALFGSTLGASLIVLGGRSASNSGGPTLQGDLLVVISLTISVGWILMNKSLIVSHGPMAVTAYSILSGTFMLVVWVFATDGPPPITGISRTAWIALACSGVLCTASTTLLWNWGIHRVPASRAGVFLNIEPALGSILGVKLLGDHLGPLAWLGGALILAAAVTITVRNHDFDTEVLLE
ncbi:DMT family transporter [Acidicapsa dinghuensis]|uniref:DMT family transporter n=1 Tax=Acidicapsa dinghuensis TaxID=2218256 RepID=A0ABW1EK84_9BACT|nr:DMT family transporter [Acidicapsa dinghuensis]